MLLSGGCGHENLRFLSPLPLDGRLRPVFDMLDQSARAKSPPNWPPYNIERASEDDYRITMALAGFSPDEIELVQKENTLFVAGHKNTDQEQGAEVLHRGIATRSFRQSFDLAEHVKVVSANFGWYLEQIEEVDGEGVSEKTQQQVTEACSRSPVMCACEPNGFDSAFLEKVLSAVT